MVDRVQILDSNFTQVFPYARPLKANVRENSRLLDHPIETGQVITDYSIVLPIEIEIPIIMEAIYYADTYQQIRSLYLSKELLTVQTLTENYSNMVIAEMPHAETPEMFDAVSLLLKFREIQLNLTASTYSPADPTQNDTVPLGQQSSYPVTPVNQNSVSGVNATSSSAFAYSSVPPSTVGTASGVQTMQGQQTIPIPPANPISVTGAATMTSSSTIGQGFGSTGSW